VDIGLNNLGNTCFMSAALQCLVRTPVFIQYFLTQQYRLDVSSKSALGSKGRVTEEFARWVMFVYSCPCMGSGLWYCACAELVPGNNGFSARHGILTADVHCVPFYRVLGILYGLPSYSRKALLSALVTTYPATSATHGAHHDDDGTGSMASPQPGAAAGNTLCHPPRADAPSSRSLVYQSYSLNSLLKLFQAHKPQFSGADQQDSQEFLCELLDTFHEDLKQVPFTAPPAAAMAPAPTNTTVATGSAKSSATPTLDDTKTADTPVLAGSTGPVLPSRSVARGDSATSTAHAAGDTAARDSPTVPADPTVSVQRQGEARWSKYLQQHSSVVSHLFQGQMCSKIICKVCHNSSATFEPFTTLSMPIPRSRNSTALSQHIDGITVVVTLYRKMPRLSQILRLPDAAFENSTLTQGTLFNIYK
jgi:hypothetical protein